MVDFALDPQERDTLKIAGIIYGALLCVTVVTGGLLLGIRALITLIRKPNIDSPKDQVGEKAVEPTNMKNESTETTSSQGSELPRLEALKLLGSSTISAMSPIRISTSVLGSSPKPLQYEELPWLPDAERNSWLKDLYEVQKTMLEESIALKEDSQELKLVKLSQCVNPSVPIPPVEFRLAWQADRAVAETKDVLLDSGVDPATKCILLVRLAGIAAAKASSQSISALQLCSFQDLVEQMVDSGIVFQIVSQLAQPKYLMLLVVDIIASYSWYVWEDKSANTRTRMTVIRTFCNLQLGLDGENTPPFVQVKLSILLEKMVLSSACYEYLAVVPMVAQGIAIAVSERTKSIFYDVLYVVLVRHRGCCIDYEYLSHSTTLRLVIAYGIDSHSQAQQKKAARLADEMAEIDFAATGTSQQSLFVRHAGDG